MLPVAVMQPTPPERMLSSRKTSLPANTSKPDFANASSIAFVLFQSPEESFTPATVRGKFFSSRSTRSRNPVSTRSEEHTSELQSPDHIVCRLLLDKKKRSTN